MQQKFAIVVAGGSGMRFGSTIPKQFLSFGSKPILMHTLEVFRQCDASISLIVVLPESHFGLWDELCQKHRFDLPHQLAKGGASRFQSVKNGLNLLPAEGLVAVHDGVRPFVNCSVIQKSFDLAAEKGNAVCSLPLKETIREIGDGSSSHSRDRSRYRLVQTPQTFSITLLKAAYRQQEKAVFTDDASVVEAMGEQINLIDSNEENVKITHPADLLLAEALWKSRNAPA